MYRKNIKIYYFYNKKTMMNDIRHQAREIILKEIW